MADNLLVVRMKTDQTDYTAFHLSEEMNTNDLMKPRSHTLMKWNMRSVSLRRSAPLRNVASSREHFADLSRPAAVPPSSERRKLVGAGLRRRNRPLECLRFEWEQHRIRRPDRARCAASFVTATVKAPRGLGTRHVLSTSRRRPDLRRKREYGRSRDVDVRPSVRRARSSRGRPSSRGAIRTRRRRRKRRCRTSRGRSRANRVRTGAPRSAGNRREVVASARAAVSSAASTASRSLNGTARAVHRAAQPPPGLRVETRKRPRRRVAGARRARRARDGGGPPRARRAALASPLPISALQNTNASACRYLTTSTRAGTPPLVPSSSDSGRKPSTMLEPFVLGAGRKRHAGDAADGDGAVGSRAGTVSRFIDGRADEAGDERVRRRGRTALRAQSHCCRRPSLQDGDAVPERHRLGLVVRDVDGRDAESRLQRRDVGAHLRRAASRRGSRAARPSGRRCGSRTIARPIATRWRCPPESWRRLALEAAPSSPSMLRDLAHAALALRASAPSRILSGKPMFAATVRYG